jgi:hypothetical protein
MLLKLHLNKLQSPYLYSRFDIEDGEDEKQEVEYRTEKLMEYLIDEAKGILEVEELVKPDGN